MLNSTQVSFFTLSAYFDPGPVRHFYLLLLLSLYTLIIGSNLLLIVVICVNRSLHEPMYMFLCSLFVNELYGSAGLYPFLLLHALSDVHTVSRFFCFLQIFSIYTYAGVEFLTLAIMSYDRYLAICCPLQYNSQMTWRRVAVLLALSWLIPVLSIVVLVSLSAPLQLCGNVLHKVYCGNYSIVKLACQNTLINNVYGLIYTMLSIVVPMLLVLYTYARILKVCFSTSSHTRHKALSTCTPHIASILNFSFGCCFQVLSSRYLNGVWVPRLLDILLSVYFLSCQPLFTPVIYGLKMSKISQCCRQLLLGPA